MKLPTYKRLLLIIGILLTLVALSSCNTIKRADRKFQRAVNKMGQKEAANYMVINYPEYFKIITKKDTIFHVDTTFIAEKDGVIVDPIIIHDTIIIENKDFSAKISKTTGKGTYKIPADTIIQLDTIYKEVKVPCPDADILALKSSKEYELWIKNVKGKTRIYQLLSFVLLLATLGLGYLYFKSKKDKI
jgi:predicted small secreted protein